MIRHRRSLLALGAIILATACGDAPEPEMSQPDPETEARAAVQELRENWVTHYNLHHPDMVADFYTEDAFVLNADQSVVEGRDALEAYYAETMAASPTAQIGTEETMVFGDHSVSWGPYSVTLSDPEGESMTVSGTYMTVLREVDGEWKIAGRIVNYDSPRPEGWDWAESGDPPSEESTMTELIEAYETHWNLRHPDMVADLHTEDGMAAFSESPVIHGRQAVAEANRETMDALPDHNLEIHGVGTLDLADGWKVDGGWYEFVPEGGGDPAALGMYMNLVEEVEGGEWKIRWIVTNGRPGSGM